MAEDGRVKYEHPLVDRYASKEMRQVLSTEDLPHPSLFLYTYSFITLIIIRTTLRSYIWSPTKKFGTWRKLWLALAEAEKDLGL
jgi:hypothetical protein